MLQPRRNPSLAELAKAPIADFIRYCVLTGMSQGGSLSIAGGCEDVSAEPRVTGASGHFCGSDAWEIGGNCFGRRRSPRCGLLTRWRPKGRVLGLSRPRRGAHCVEAELLQPLVDICLVNVAPIAFASEIKSRPISSRAAFNTSISAEIRLTSFSIAMTGARSSVGSSLGGESGRLRVDRPNQTDGHVGLLGDRR